MTYDNEKTTGDEPAPVGASRPRKDWFGRVLFALTLLGSILVLGVVAVPGRAPSLLFALLFAMPCVVVSLVPVAGIGFLFLLGHLQSKPRAEESQSPPALFWRRAAVGLLIVTVAMSVFRVPQRIGLAVWRPDFMELFEDAPDGYGGGELHRRIGIYHIDRYAADGRGGVYFRTYYRPDGLGPDIMSYGFAYQPDPQRTPFGSSTYSLGHLFGDWYTFAVSDD